MDYFTLTDYEIQETVNALVLVNGNRIYKKVLARAFPDNFLSRTFDDRYGRYEWGTYIYNVNEDNKKKLRTLLDKTKEHVYIDDDLTETFALDFHSKTSPGGFKRTDVGELVYGAKPYSKPVNQANHQRTQELSEMFAEFISCHPSYARASLILPIPPSRADKPFDLPNELAQLVASKVGKETSQSAIQKMRSTRPMKDCGSVQEKIENVRDAFDVSERGTVEGREIIIIDDIYQTGFTLNEVGSVLFEAGARSVYGLVATKTALDL